MAFSTGSLYDAMMRDLWAQAPRDKQMEQLREQWRIQGRYMQQSYYKFLPNEGALQAGVDHVAKLCNELDAMPRAQSVRRSRLLLLCAP